MRRRQIAMGTASHRGFRLGNEESGEESDIPQDGIAQKDVAYLGLGLLARKLGNLPEAAGDFQRSIEIQPTAFAYQQLADVLDGLGEKKAAEAARARAAN